MNVFIFKACMSLSYPVCGKPQRLASGVLATLISVSVQGAICESPGSWHRTFHPPPNFSFPPQNEARGLACEDCQDTCFLYLNSTDGLHPVLTGIKLGGWWARGWPASLVSRKSEVMQSRSNREQARPEPLFDY